MNLKKSLVRQPEDINNLMPIKYEWIMKMYRNGIANSWFPQEVPMGNDKVQYDSQLNEAEKHVFTNTLSFLTTADVLALRNISYALSEKLSSPEAQVYLSRQAFEEGVHMESYAHAIETIGLDQEDMYTRYKTVPEIAAKSEMLTRRTTAICSLPNNLKKDSDLEEFLHSLFFFSGIFEGCSFMTNFLPIFALKRRNLMTGTAKQLEFIRRDEQSHVGFGLRIIKEITKETGVKLNPDKIQEMFEESLDVEIKYIEYILKNPIFGYSVKDHILQFKWYCNSRASFMGLSRPFIDGKYLSWVEEIVDSKKEANFFEETVTEYQSSSMLTWDDCTKGINLKDNWKDERAPEINGQVCMMEEGCVVCT
jgi:ribonucleoside-diphosphate reductase beta chain